MALRMGFGVGLVPWMSRTFGTELVSAQIRKPQYTADGRLIGIRAIEQVKQLNLMSSLQNC